MNEGSEDGERLGADCAALEPFALVIRDETFWPELTSGDVVLVEAARGAEPGDWILANGAHGVLAGVLRGRQEGLALETLDGASSLYAPGAFVVTGVIRGVRRRGRRARRKTSRGRSTR